MEEANNENNFLDPNDKQNDFVNIEDLKAIIFGMKNKIISL